MNGPVLLVEDTPSLRLIYAAALRREGLRVLEAGTAEEGDRLFAAERPGMVLLDLMLPDRAGLDLMREMLARAPSTAIIVVTSDGSIDRAVTAMRGGAMDFLVKPFSEERLVASIRNAEAANRPGAPRAAVAPEADADVHGLDHASLLGASPQMQEIGARIRAVARSSATVFVTGESGTGKELCARAIHAASPRAAGPFVPLNCGAIPQELHESEVFGHLEGAFPGALADKEGAAAAADGGTLFLDEICETSPPLQTKLVRFLQSATILPVGATVPRRVDLRIICATSRDPMEEVRQGRFREDLYYRLHVVPIHMPPLRERGDDVLEIARHALARLAAEEGKRFEGLSEEVATLFRALPWPGNVRQLLNVLRHVAVLHDGPLVTPGMLPDDLRAAPDDPPEHAASPPRDLGAAVRMLGGLTLAEIERLVIEAAVARNGGSLPRAARELGVSPSTLYRKRSNWAAGH